MPTVAELIEESRKELLDLTTRNRLLSLPKQSKSARLIHAIDERSDQLFRILVEEKKSFGFLPGRQSVSKSAPTDGTGKSIEPDEEELDPSAINLPPPDEEELASGGPLRRHVDTKYQTALTPEGLQRRLLDFYDESRTMLEEQGVNILYLALGQLKWSEANDSESERYAPLVLVPIELVRRSASERFQMKWQEQDVLGNLSLEAKLRNDFGLQLPHFEIEDHTGLTSYFEAVAKAVQNVPGWEVMPNEITIGFFSFAKFLMYRDLDPANWPDEKKIDSHPMIRALMVDGYSRRDPPFANDANIDELIPAKRLDHVIDADGSQTLVIEHVRHGRDLVVQGPPGTGKSQTITNIIATAVLDGKRVLFVAEKMAALEVVHRRLSAQGLGEICLELHSNKSNKRSVLEELKRTWNLNRPVSNGRESVVGKLQELRDRLTSHAADLHETNPKTGCSAYRVLGELASLRESGVRPFDFRFESPEDWSQDEVAKLEKALADTVERLEVIGKPKHHPWTGVRLEMFLRLDEDPLKQRIARAQTARAVWVGAGAEVSAYLESAPATTRREFQKQLATAEQVAKAPPLDRQALCHGVWNAGLRDLRELITIGRAFEDARDKTSGQVILGVWDQDFASVRAGIAAHGESLFRIFSSEYRKAIRDLKAVMTGPVPKEYTDRLALVDRILAGQQAAKTLKERDETGKSAFGEVWRGRETKWPEANSIYEWVEQHTASGFSASFRQYFARIKDLGLAAELVRKAKEADAQFDSAISSLVEFTKLDELVALGSTREDVAVETWATKLVSWSENVHLLPDWVNYYARATQLRSMKAGCLIDAIEADTLASAELVDAFSWTYYGQLLRYLTKLNPRLGAFDGVLHERLVNDFKETDKARIQYARLATLLKHYDGLPPTSSGVGPTGVLRGEAEKKRNHKPIRQLLKLAGEAVQAIKPVFMMSPLSVAQFLEPGVLEFDLLVIDEASQVEPVDSLGAIARSKQIVVVGDSRQLPPTKFFARVTGDGAAADDGVAATKDLESVLGLCLARGLPEKMLRWHYRSKHHTLIAVSNHEFYDNGLFIVPSPLPSTGQFGLRFRHIPNGVFDSGKTAVNKVEAEIVARAVIEHAKTSPKESLGVAAFSIKQRQAIQDELELLRRQSPETESFFAAHPHEPFFVKNLENVQGDERDVIFISVGYGRDATGFMAMRFGPLSIDGGERRLNVLISRAKKRCEVFSSIKADDIDLARASGRGVASFKSFLRFAETGRLGSPKATNRGEDSVFEEAVKGALEKHGFAIDCQVGEAGFFIDLAVRDESRGNRYILAIECDGATYHSSKSARDRDRLRQAVLEDHGWFVHRIWSTDWFQRPEREIRRVLEAIELARRKIDLEIIEEKAIAAESKIERETATANNDSLSVAYSLARIVAPTSVELVSLTPGQVGQYVRFVLDAEAPIHLDELVVRIRTAWGLERAGARIQELIQKTVRLVLIDKKYASDGEFLLVRSVPVPVRDRSSDELPSSLRKPERIAPHEIRAAILAVLEHHLGAAADEIPTTVARLFGFKAVSSQIREMIEQQILNLASAGQIVDHGGYFKRASSANPDTPIR